MDRREEARQKALNDLQNLGVLMLNGHFDYGNGYHGRVYLNSHQLFLHPSTIWRFAQDLLDVLPPDVVASTELVAGPVTGGALLAHTMAGLLDARRSLSRPPCAFAPFTSEGGDGLTLRAFYRHHVLDRHVLLVDDVRNTGRTFEQCANLVRRAGGTVVATAEIYDRGAPKVTLDVPNIPLAVYPASETYPAETCPLCRDAEPVTRF